MPNNVDAMLQPLMQDLDSAIQNKDTQAIAKFIPQANLYFTQMLQNLDIQNNDPEMLSKVLALENDFPALLYLLEGIDLQKSYLFMLMLEFSVYAIGEEDPITRDKILTFFRFAKSNFQVCALNRPIELYDFRFLSGVEKSHPQELLGKAKKEGKIYPPVETSLLAHIAPEYYQHDADPALSILLMTTEQKKNYKIRQTNEHLSRGNKPFEAGDYAFVVTPKGGLYAIHEEDIANDPLIKKFHHSSIRAGQPVMCAGMMEFEENASGQMKITSISDGSGHYKPTVSQLCGTALWLHSQGLLDEDCMIGSYDAAGACFSVKELIQYDEKVKAIFDPMQYAFLKKSYLPEKDAPIVRPSSIVHHKEIQDNSNRVDLAKPGTHTEETLTEVDRLSPQKDKQP